MQWNCWITCCIDESQFEKNDEVIMPAMTMSAVAYAILLSGAKPIFADIDKQTLNIDVSQLKKK